MSNGEHGCVTNVTRPDLTARQRAVLFRLAYRGIGSAREMWVDFDDLLWIYAKGYARPLIAPPKGTAWDEGTVLVPTDEGRRVAAELRGVP